MKRTNFLAAAVVAALSAIAGLPASAQNSSQELLVRADSVEVCALTEPTATDTRGAWFMDFGPYDRIAQQPLYADFSFDVDCVLGVPYYVTIGEGSGYHAVEGRRMSRVGGHAAFMPYTLYRDAARTDEWLPDEPSTTRVSDGTGDTWTIYGMVPGGLADLERGIYSSLLRVRVFIDG